VTNLNQQLDKIRNEPGFIAALDQSGGSTPKALANYGVGADAYNDDDEMFAVVHKMRSRIMTSPAFNGNRIMGAILFENTMDREVEGQATADYLWNVKRVVPFLKVDKGLADEQDGAQIMKPMPGLAELLQKAAQNNIFGTKMRSVIKTDNPAGVNAVVDQQFEIGRQILAAGLVPIIEPAGDPDANDYQVNHGVTLFLINPEGRLQAIFEPDKGLPGTHTFDADKILRDYLAIRQYLG